MEVTAWKDRPCHTFSHYSRCEFRGGENAGIFVERFFCLLKDKKTAFFVFHSSRACFLEDEKGYEFCLLKDNPDDLTFFAEAKNLLACVRHIPQDCQRTLGR